MVARDANRRYALSTLQVVNDLDAAGDQVIAVLDHGSAVIASVTGVALEGVAAIMRSAPPGLGPLRARGTMMWPCSFDGRLLMNAGERRPELQVLSDD